MAKEGVPALLDEVANVWKACTTSDISVLDFMEPAPQKWQTNDLFSDMGFVNQLNVCAVAALLLILGLFLHSVDWGSQRVRALCGPRARVFNLGDCRLGQSVTLYRLI